MSTVTQEKIVQEIKQKKHASQKVGSVKRLRDVILEEKKQEASKPIYLVRYE